MTNGDYDALEPLAERFPVYLKIFAIGLATTAALGLIYWLLSSSTLVDSVGYTMLLAGTLLLLVGGARGGGYTNLGLGAAEALIGGRNRFDDDYVDDDEVRSGKVLKKRDPMERLRRGLRPQANPEAFWMTIAGFGYLAVGLALITVWA